LCQPLAPGLLREDLKGSGNARLLALLGGMTSSKSSSSSSAPLPMPVMSPALPSMTTTLLASFMSTPASPSFFGTELRSAGGLLPALAGASPKTLFIRNGIIVGKQKQFRNQNKKHSSDYCKQKHIHKSEQKHSSDYCKQKHIHKSEQKTQF
jgi:hypothetical protein